MARLTYDNLYFFRYKNPATNPKIWDTAPLIIPLEITSRSILAVNLHWIPQNERAKFVEFIMKHFGVKQVGSRKRQIRLFYRMLKSRAPRYLVAIRRYHVRLMSGVKEIPKEMWPTVLKQRKYRERKQKNTSIRARISRYLNRRR